MNLNSRYHYILIGTTINKKKLWLPCFKNSPDHRLRKKNSNHNVDTLSEWVKMNVILNILHCIDKLKCCMIVRPKSVFMDEIHK